MRWFWILPYIFGLSGLFRDGAVSAICGCGAGATGGVVDLLSGASPLRRGVRQILIGFGAAFVTYLLGLAFGTTVG